MIKGYVCLYSLDPHFLFSELAPIHFSFSKMPAIRTSVVTGRTRSATPYQTTVMVSAAGHNKTVHRLNNLHAASVVAAENLLDFYRDDRHVFYRDCTAKLNEQAKTIEQQAKTIQDLATDLAAHRLKVLNPPHRIAFRKGGSMTDLYYPCQDCIEHPPTRYKYTPPIGHPDYDETRSFWNGKAPKKTCVDLSEMDYDSSYE